MCGPSCLTQAYKIARQAELSVEGQEKRNRTIARPNLPIPTAPKFLKGPENFDRKQTLYLPPPVKQATVPSDNTRMTFEHMRKLGLCYWCGEKYRQGHKCQKKKLHLLEATEVEEGECSTNIENKVDFHIQEMAEEGYEQADISMCSPQGMEGTQTLKFKGVIKQLPILALIDSGSTHSFIHPSVVHLIELPTIPSPPMLVKTASGSKLLSDLKCQTLQFTLHNHQFEGEFRVLEVQGYDIILGMDWIAMVGPVIIDCVQGLVKLKHHGKEISLKVQNEVAEVKLCLGELCISKEQQKGSDIILAQLFITQLDDANTCTSSTASQHHILPPLQEVLDAFSVVFSDPSSLPPVRSIDHQIPLQFEAVPVNIRPYRFSHFQKLEIEKIVEELLLSGYIRASTSPFVSPILLVKKKDQSWRLCVDYRKLNDVTVKNKFPIPIIDDLLDELHGAKFFSKLDLKSGYHQIRMFEPDIPKTAFRTHMGHYEFTVMPFGLTNAPATFQALMNSIFKPYLRKFILIFFDDILVFSTSLEEHKNHLATTLQILQKNQLFAKLSKCVIGATEVEYLGHIISENGVSIDPSKVVSMTDWPTPKTVKQLRGFLGLTGYYRKFIKGYGVLSRPLTDLLKKDAFKWTDSAQSAFLQLKSAMCQAPVLALPDFTKPFIVETDASQMGIGAVLMQEKRPIAFFSKGLGQKNQGASNVVADALSRREGYTDTVSPLHSELHMVSEIVPQWVTDLLSSYEGDNWIASLKTKLSTDNAATHHLTEHQGSLVTYKRLKSLFYWPSMKEHVMEHVRNCENCQLTKPEHTPLPGLLQPLPIPPEAWNSIGMDFITGLPKSEGKEVLLIVVDRLTKYGHFLPLAHPYSAATVAQTQTANVMDLKSQLAKAQDRMKKFADSKRSERHFNKGDWVYLKLQPYRQLSVSGTQHNKLSPKFYGPYEILEKVGPVAYKLHLPAASSIHPVVHVFQLKARVGSGQAVAPQLPLMGHTAPSLHLPAAILARRLIKRRNAPIPQIFVQWQDLPPEEASWEDYDVIKQKFPTAILEDKDNFNGGGMSDSTVDLEVTVGTIDLVNASGESSKRSKEEPFKEGVTSGDPHELNKRR
ncbi:hypothetical protein LUZ61_012960 [Rhynchospora tenuis]|uniref:Reverse transcriptase domain-containing protein n=1 Tax=Rhynchospora tenuis TaxID=198213 RepID=A0AAD6F217_9POAL|nr:hypothetical protein LUZ61_012960 [Rhynchospora tenuis]